MPRSMGEIISLLRQGIGVEVSAKDFSLGELIAMVNSAIEGDAILLIKDSDELTMGEIQAIAQRGKRNVIFR